MKTFYQYSMMYRGVQKKDDEKRKLADWMFKDHNFPKYSDDYDELSRYLEYHSPFPEATKTFDELWDEYVITK
ncbi:YozE family protein [Bacillaceae bacterium W0354]